MLEITSQNTGIHFHIGNPVGEFQPSQTAYHFTRKDYFSWSQLIQTTLKSEDKLIHLLGIGPKTEDSIFDAWEKKDSIIMTEL